MESASYPPLDDRKRKRLQTCYMHAKKTMAQEEYDFDYVTGLTSQCLGGDPSNSEYMDIFLENLYKKYNFNKKGRNLGALAMMTPRSAMRKAIDKNELHTAVEKAMEVFKVNPWDTGALQGMATVAEKLNYDDVELKWLKNALVSAPTDPDVNRQCALALARRRQYDQAIACWHRVEVARPADEEPKRQISNLDIQKRRAMEGVEETAPQPGSRGPGGAEPDSAYQATPEQRLKRAITKQPDALENYFELAQLYVSTEKYAKAAEILAAALQASNNDPDVREKWEDVDLQRLRQDLSLAESKAKASGKAEDAEAYKKVRNEVRKRELEVYKFRVERYPTNLPFKYELGVRYQLVGQFAEAIKQFQSAQNDPKHKGLCLLAMGECFQQIKQYRLAMTNYAQAVENIPDRDVTNKKQALYQAGRLALGLKDAKLAGKFLTDLAQMDFGYRDIATLLEKLEALTGNAPAGGDAKKE